MTITSNTRLAAVIGWPVSHSLSPAMHNQAFARCGVDAVFLALPVAPDHLEAVVRGLAAANALGLSVTVPHKEAMMEICDRLEPSAQAVGAVNCVLFEGGQIIGLNTDADGFAESLQEDAGCAVQGASVVILGAGGAARAVHHGLTKRGAASVDVVARRPQAVTWTSAIPFEDKQLDRLLPSSDVLVDCTPTGLVENGFASLPARPALERLPEQATVASLVYHREPELLAEARALGRRTLDGVGMLARQGALAFERWTGHTPPLGDFYSAVRSHKPPIAR